LVRSLQFLNSNTIWTKVGFFLQLFGMCLWKLPSPATVYARTSAGRPVVCFSLPAPFLLAISDGLLRGHPIMFQWFPVFSPDTEW
jgi:hypothetical protein